MLPYFPLIAVYKTQLLSACFNKSPHIIYIIFILLAAYTYAVLYHPITYYSTVPLILDHSYLVGKLTSSKIADTKVSGF